MTRRAPSTAHRHRRSLGQALVELAVAAPFLTLLLAGTGQVGAIAYGQISVDTAAREGARVAAENVSELQVTTNVPNCPTNAPTCCPVGTSSSCYQCANPPSSDPNGVCRAVAAARGALQLGSFDSVLIIVHAPVSLVPDDVHLVSSSSSGGGSNCGSNVAISGAVSPLGISATATVTATQVGGNTIVSTQTQPGNGAYLLCVPKVTGSSTSSYNVVAKSGTCSGSYPTQVQVQRTDVPNINITLSCPTPTPSSTTTTSSTGTTSSGTSSGSSSTSSGGLPAPNPSTSCTYPTYAPAGSYVKVDVRYEVPVFVPLVGALFANSSSASSRVVETSVTMPIDPCSITASS